MRELMQEEILDESGYLSPLSLSLSLPFWTMFKDMLLDVRRKLLSARNADGFLPPSLSSILILSFNTYFPLSLLLSYLLILSSLLLSPHPLLSSPLSFLPFLSRILHYFSRYKDADNVENLVQNLTALKKVIKHTKSRDPHEMTQVLFPLFCHISPFPSYLYQNIRIFWFILSFLPSHKT